MGAWIETNVPLMDALQRDLPTSSIPSGWQPGKGDRREPRAGEGREAGDRALLVT